MEKIFREIKQKMILRQNTKLNFPAHVHDDIELVFVEEGGGTAYCDGKQYLLQKDTFFLVFPNQVHRYVDCGGSRYMVVIIKPTDLLGYTQIFGQGVPVSALMHVREPEERSLPQLLKMALEEFQRNGPSTVVAAYLTALFGKLLGTYEIQKTAVTGDTVLQILQYCKTHYREDITVGTVAEQLGISQSSVSHIFSTRLSMNFCSYINSLRLADAEKLLKNQNYSVTEVAGRCGFSTIRTFNRAFLKQYGMPPSHYRKMQKKPG